MHFKFFLSFQYQSSWLMRSLSLVACRQHHMSLDLPVFTVYSSISELQRRKVKLGKVVFV